MIHIHLRVKSQIGYWAAMMGVWFGRIWLFMFTVTKGRATSGQAYCNGKTLFRKYKHGDIFSILRRELPKFAYCGTKNVAIYAYSSGKFLDYGKYACVKVLTNIMSGPMDIAHSTISAQFIQNCPKCQKTQNYNFFEKVPRC